MERANKGGEMTTATMTHLKGRIDSLADLYLSGVTGGSDFRNQLDGILWDGSPTDLNEIRSADFSTLNPDRIAELRTGARWVYPDDPKCSFIDYRDHRNYIFLNPKQFDEIIEGFNKLADQDRETPFLLAFFTGGTLAMVRGDDKILHPAKDGSELLKFAGYGLENEANLRVVETPMIDSADMKRMLISEIVGAYHYIVRKLSPEAQRLFAGSLIGHGTDTGSASGSNIRLMHTAHNVSVGLVAAQRSADNPIPDGPSNIATTILSLLEMRRQGVSDLFIHSGGGTGGKLFGMGHTTKDTDTGVIIFASRGYEPVCDLSRGSLKFNRGEGSKRSDSGLPPLLFDGFNPVQFCPLHQNDDPRRIIDSFVGSSATYCVLTSFGAGTAPQDVIRALMFTEAVFRKRAEPERKPRQRILVNTAFSDADLGHSYESNILLQKAGIPVVCATEDLIAAKASLANQITPDPEMRFRFLLTPFNGDYPDSYAAHAARNNKGLLLTHQEIEGLQTRLGKVG